MIFVTVGTHHQPFTRLLDALGSLDPAELVVQYGPGEPPPGVARAADFMPFEEMVANFKAADTVVTHAGVGSILCARREGHTPLVVPRRHDLGEHVDEHQTELTRALEARGSVVAVWETERLGELVRAVPPRVGVGHSQEPPLCPAVRLALAGSSQSSDA